MNSWLGAMLSVLAAVGFAAAAVLQHGAVAGTGVRLRVLVTNRRWLAGLGCLAGAATVHVVALAIAPLSVVQPLGVLALVCTTGFAIRSARRRPRAAELWAVGLTVAGVGGFVLCTAGTVTATGTDMFAAPLIVAGLVGVGALVGWCGRGAVRCAGFAGAGAAGYALVSVLTRIAAVRIESTGLTVTAVLGLAGGAAAALLGGWLIQHAYASGSADLVLACQTVGDPAVAVGIGLVVLGEAAALPLAMLPALIGCAVIAVTGIVVLARDRSRHTLHIGQSTSDSNRKAGEPHDVVSVG